MARQRSERMVSEDIRRLISEDIQQRRDEYLQLMHEHGTKSPDEIIQSLRETQEQLLALFESASEEQALRKPAPDEWSLHELAAHAAFTERLIAKIIHYGSRNSVPPAEDLEGAGIGMMPKDEYPSYAGVLAALRQRNADLLEAVRDLPEEPNMDMKMPHPFFGPLNCLEWAGFQRVHDTDHIQHAGKILASTKT
jgi:hypothetical protein